MRITIHAVIDPQDGTAPHTHLVGTLERGDLTPATAGLALAEAHDLVSTTQQHLVAAQA